MLDFLHKVHGNKFKQSAAEIEKRLDCITSVGLVRNDQNNLFFRKLRRPKSSNELKFHWHGTFTVLNRKQRSTRLLIQSIVISKPETYPSYQTHTSVKCNCVILFRHLSSSNKTLVIFGHQVNCFAFIFHNAKKFDNVT